MRTLRKNKQLMYYALLIGEEPIYELDENGNKIVDYVDDEGNEYYRETGEYELAYSEPVSFYGNISMSSGESEPQEYGVDVSAYDAVIILDKNQIPATETSYIWHTSEVGYKDSSKTRPDVHTADYRVIAVKPSLNQLKLILGRVVK